MKDFPSSNEWQWQLVCIIVQGVIGVVVALELGHSKRSLNARLLATNVPEGTFA